MTATTNKKIKRPFNGVKFIEVCLGLFLIIVIGLLLLGFYPVSHPRLTRHVVAIVKQRGLDSCSIGKVTVAVWKGVSFHDVALAGKTPEGDTYSFKASAVTVKCNLFMLAIKSSHLKKLVAAEFGGSKNSDRNGPERTLQSVLRIIGASQYIKGATVSRADVAIVGKRSMPVQGSGIALDINFPPETENRFNGSFVATALVCSKVEGARQLSGDFSYDNGTVIIPRCKAKAFDGRIKLETRFNLEKRTLSALTLSMAGLDLSEWSRFSDSGDGTLAGKADAKFTLDSSVFDPDSLHGKGTVSVSHFEIVKFPFQRSLVTMLMYPGLSHLNFRKFKANLTLKEGKLFEAEATGEGDTLSVKTDGWIRTDGLLNEKLECTLAKAGVATLPEFAQKTLEDAPGGGKVLKCRLYGMIQNPKVSVESKVILQKAVKNMFEEIKSNLQQWMR